MSLIGSTDSLEEIRNRLLSCLSKAGQDKGSAFRFIVLNTLTESFPDSRYVVLRDFNRETQELLIHTDVRSNKVEEIKANPLVSAIAYDMSNKCQVKLMAKARIHHQDEKADEQWESLEGGKESYNTKAQPGKKVGSLKEAHQMKEEYDDEYFAVIVLKVLQAEILQLSGHGHIRAVVDFKNDEKSFLVP